MGTKDFIKHHILARLITILVITVAFLGFVLYYFAIIDFSFIKRPSSWPKTPDAFYNFFKDNRKANQTETSVPQETLTEDITTVTDEEPTATETKTEESEEFTLSSAAQLKEDGFVISTEDYDLSDFRLGIVVPGVKISGEQSLRKKLSARLDYRKTYESSLKQAAYVPIYVNRYAVELYMGYILADDGEEISVLDSDGRYICKCPENTEPAYTRDRNGNPVFKNSDTGEYFIIGENGEFTSSDYNDITDSRGLYYDYLEDFGSGNSDIRTTYSLNGSYIRYGYSSTENVYFWNNLKRAYEFNDGYAFYVTEVSYVDRPIEVGFILKEGSYSGQSSFKAYYNKENRYVVESFRLPASFGEESIGYFNFDHGLIRMRKVCIDQFNFDAIGADVVYTDEELLVYSDMTEYQIPYGYELKAYSCGMVLLEKDGMYGFMDYTNGWVIQPVLAGATPYYEGLAVVTYENGEVALIDKNGNEVIPRGMFDYISRPSSGVISVYSEGSGWMILQKMTASRED